MFDSAHRANLVTNNCALMARPSADYLKMVSLKKQDSVEQTLAKSSDLPLMKAFATLFAVGLSDSQVAEALGESEQKVGIVRQVEQIQDLVLKIQLAMGQSPEARIASAVHQAIDVKLKALADEKDKKSQLGTATELLDRQFGKPVQMVASISATLKTSRTVAEVDNKFDALMERLKALETRRMLMVNAPKKPDLKVLDI